MSGSSSFIKAGVRRGPTLWSRSGRPHGLGKSNWISDHAPHFGYGLPLFCAAFYLLQLPQLGVFLTLAVLISLVMMSAVSAFLNVRMPPIPSVVSLGVMASVLLLMIARFPMDMALPASGLFMGLGFSAGALLKPRELRWAVPVWTTVLWTGVGTAGELPVSDPFWALLMSGLLFAGATMMGRSLLYGSIVSARAREQARMDETLLRLSQDASLFRLTGGEAQQAGEALFESESEAQLHPQGAKGAPDPCVEHSEKRDLYRLVSSIDAFKDGLYRQLRLGVAHLEPADGFVYFLDLVHSLQ